VGGYGGTFGSSVLVGPAALEAVAPLLEPASLPAARRALATGGAAAFDAPSGRLEVRRQRTTSFADGATERYELLGRAEVAATTVRASATSPPAQVVLGEAAAAQLGDVRTVALLVGDGLSRAEQDRLSDALSLVDPTASAAVERGFDDDSGPVVLLLGLAAFGLVLAGTLAATSLALVESGPDLATLSQVGARPRTRRGIAGGYAAVLALSGGLLGTCAGLVPGAAAAVALTRHGAQQGWVAYGATDDLPTTTFLVVPWALLLGLLVGLPLVAGAVAAAGAGRRQPPATRRAVA
jgi:putative ABC transport system permease protein